MTAPRPEIDPQTLRVTAEATNPANSAWVSANAGSGKTYVLSRRVIRLLLAGVDPARILCLTFTKAAAAEMAKRIFAILAEWATLPDAKLAEALAELEGAAPDRSLLATARRLFARALDTPGGLKIQTIHAFCERLLHQFPFEANVAGHFEVLDERDETALSSEARRAVLARAAADPGGMLGQALATVLALVSDFTHEASVAEFVEKRDQIAAWTIACGSFDSAISDLRRALGVGRGETSEWVTRRIVDEAPLDAAAARRLVELLRGSGPGDVSAAERLAPFATSDDLDMRLDAWCDFLLTKGEPRKSPVTNAIKKQWPGLDVLLDTEAPRLLALLDRLRTAELFESSVAMLRLADAAIAEYARLKRQRGVLDFEDLIVKTVALLSRADAARWVQYKLDRGLDHILVDEAQDTSPRQWQVIAALAEEFFAGEGASASLRTLFAVGDEKQSIFSFQGALPAWFTEMRARLGGKALAAGYAWLNRELHLSFRSVPAVLDAVDTVFAAESVHRGLTAETRATLHTARRRNQPGRVAIWPAFVPPEKPATQDWVTPVDHLGRDSPEVQLARRIADTIRGWLDRRETLDAPDSEGRPRPIRPGSILILTRTRGALTDAINRALKGRDISIAGADRITLTEHIAVMDLMALGRVVLLPEDDLSLAALLRSPLIGLGEDGLYRLAHGRPGSLWDSLGHKASDDLEFAAARALIDGWQNEADRRDPHAFYARILGPGRGRQAFLRRLGPEAEDVIDEFLTQALAYEQANVPSLEGFLAWMVASETEVKRDPETLRDEVRVMTVHGAKGLEADIVFLIDNGTYPSVAAHDAKLLSLAEAYDPRNPGPFVWMRSITQMPVAVAEKVKRARIRSEEEYRRLLYVGMTRARDRLYLLGIVKVTPREDTRWHALARAALEGECVSTTDGDGGETLEWRAPASPAAAPAAEPSPVVAVALPEWAQRDAPAAPPAPLRITPSTALGDWDGEAAAPFGVREDAARALARGRLVHRLLQSLPDIAENERDAIGAAYLAAFAGEWPANERTQLLAEVLAVMAEPSFAPVFAAGSRAEVDLAGRITIARGEATVSGRVDRLAVTAERVLIVDYKTNRPAPESLESVPRDYVGQLALYRTLLRRLYPDRPVSAALFDRAELMEIPAAMLDSAESAIAAA